MSSTLYRDHDRPPPDVPLSVDTNDTNSSRDSSSSSTPTLDSTESSSLDTQSTSTSASSTTSTATDITARPAGILNLTFPRMRAQSLPDFGLSEGGLDGAGAGGGDGGGDTPLSTQSASTTSLKIKFAPLPQLAPRKRKSTALMGVANRGAMMRRRREQRMQQYGYDAGSGDEGNAMWTEEEVDAHMRRQAQARERGRRDEDEEEFMEDPFVTFGKMVKGAWKKVASKEKGKGKEASSNPSSSPSPNDDNKEERKGSGDGKDGGNANANAEGLKKSGSKKMKKKLKSSGKPEQVGQQPREVLAVIPDPNEGHDEELEPKGGLWEDEIGRDFPIDLSSSSPTLEDRERERQQIATMRRESLLNLRKDSVSSSDLGADTRVGVAS